MVFLYSQRVAPTLNPAHVVNSSVINALVQNSVVNPPAAANKAAKEELLLKQRELLELKQRKLELEQELKMLRPTSNVVSVHSHSYTISESVLTI